MAKINPSEFLAAIADAVDGVEMDDLSLALALADIPNWDSLAKLSVVAELEERFGADVGLADLAGCETLEDLQGVVESRTT